MVLILIVVLFPLLCFVIAAFIKPPTDRRGGFLGTAYVARGLTGEKVPEPEEPVVPEETEPVRFRL
ncbi:hypothetical protein [Deinococcus pimensis]|uniref:hypothetical protein n=1 Tax=Deinococcus pimensis TaxID=309888 RepID=UPI00048960C9|nr:hypothetical protein [Deinococcus pimensis]